VDLVRVVLTYRSAVDRAVSGWPAAEGLFPPPADPANGYPSLISHHGPRLDGPTASAWNVPRSSPFRSRETPFAAERPRGMPVSSG